MSLDSCALFKECLTKEEPLFDPFYQDEGLIISKNSNDQKTEIMKVQRSLIERICAAKIAKKDEDVSGYKKN